MSTNDIYNLLKTSPLHGVNPEYAKKMFHKIPDTESVDRVRWLILRLSQKRVLHIGCNGPLHEKLKLTADIDGVDKEGSPDFRLDIERDRLPRKQYDYILCGEILEHLSNPGRFLDKLKEYNCPIIITVPNAFCTSGYTWVKKEIENVNLEHVAYYSYNTLKTLVERHGYTVREFYWHKGPPLVAEGIIFVVEI